MRMRRLFKMQSHKTKLIFFLLAILFTSAIIASILLPQQLQKVISINQPVSVVKDKFLQCENKVSPELIGSCLNDLTKFAYDRYQVSDIVTVLDSLTYKQKERWCHETMHYLGWKVYDKTQDIGKAFTEASALCDSGMYHGIIEEYLNKHGLSGNIEDTLKNICAASLSKESEYSEGTLGLCEHGIGHALMYLTGSDLQKSLDYCDYLKENERGNCYGGVYMEYTNSYAVGPLKNAADLSDSTFCQKLKEGQKPDCYKRVGANNYSRSDNDNIVQAMNWCFSVEKEYQRYCFLGVGSNIPAPNKPYTETGAVCTAVLTLSEDVYKACIEGALGFVTQLGHGGTKEFSEFCEASDPSHKNYCYYVAGYMLKGWLTKDETYEVKCNELVSEEARSSCKKGGASDSIVPDQSL